jgi:hypothetical protein
MRAIELSLLSPTALLILAAGLCGCAEILGYGDNTSSAAGAAGTAGAGAATSTGGTAGTSAAGAAGTAGTGGTAGTSTGGAAGMSTGGAAGSAGSGECKDGDMEACYDGPPGTEGIGLCKAGNRTCQSGNWGPCDGQTEPTFEQCDTPADESCDQIAACKGLYRWAHRFGGGGSQRAWSVAADSMGNVYVAGTTDESFMVDPDAMSLPFEGAMDMLLLKLDRDGKLLWANTYGSLGDDIIRDIRVDKQDNVLFVGSVGGAVDFGEGALTFVGGIDVFAAKLDPTGKELWSVSFGDGADQYLASLALDGEGNVLAIGTYQGTFAVGSTMLTSLTGMTNNVFVVKLSGEDGKPVWAKGYDLGSSQVGTRIAATPAGDALVAADVQGIFDFCGQDVNQGAVEDVAVGKLAAGDGACLWGKRYAAAASQGSSGLVSLADGSPVFAMYYKGTVDLGGGMLVGNANTFSTAVVQLDPAGNFKWAAPASANAGDQVIQRLAVDRDDQIVASGYFQVSINFGKTQADQLTAQGQRDFFLVKLDPELQAYRWGRSFENADNGAARVAVDPLGNILFVGSLFGSTDFGGGELLSAGGADIVVGGFSP